MNKMSFDFLDFGFPKSGTDWKSINGKPYITVSSKGRSNGLSNKINDGADFGVDTTLGATSPNQTGAPYTQTSGRQEAVNYASTFSPIPRIQLLDGTHSASATTYLPTGIKISGNGNGTQINPNDTTLTVFKNLQNQGTQEISDMLFIGSAYRGIDMSNFTSTNNGVGTKIHDIRFNTQYVDCGIDMDNAGSSIIYNINYPSGTTSAYSLRWNVSGESIRINNFIDGSTNGMLLSADAIRMIQCETNKITFNLAFQTIHTFDFKQGTLNGFATSNPTFAFIVPSAGGNINNFHLDSVLWQQGGMTSLFDLSQVAGGLSVVVYESACDSSHNCMLY